MSKVQVCAERLQLSLLGDSCWPYLVILAAGAEAEDEQVSVGVGGCKVLSVWTALAVKQRSVPLALDLSTAKIHKRYTLFPICQVHTAPCNRFRFHRLYLDRYFQ